MTNNHLLLFRIAELMLEHEQHIMSVDLLFNDERIGDFVKSIQIDSPYQQMLQEGVLTESVRDEKLCVSFTVEGYFHYMLGEIIYNKNENRGAEGLKRMFEENKLNGVKKGIEQCLIRDVLVDDFKRFMWLNNQNGPYYEICVVPLSYAFLNIKGDSKKQIEFEKNIKDRIVFITDLLLKKCYQNSIKTLTKTIAYLVKTENSYFVKFIYHYIITVIKLDTFDNALILFDSITYIPKTQAELILENLSSINLEAQSKSQTAYFWGKLGKVYFRQPMNEYDRAIECFEIALGINSIIKNNSISIAVNYNELGLCWMKKENYEKAIDCHLKALEIEFRNGKKDHSSSFDSLGLAFMKKNNHNKAIEYFHKSLDIKLRTFGQFHSNTSTTLTCIAMAFSKNNDIDLAIKYWRKSLEIEIGLNENKKTIAMIYRKIGFLFNKKLDLLNTVYNYEKSLHFYLSLNQNVKTETKKIAFVIAKSQNSLGINYYKNTKYIEALELFENSYSYLIRFEITKILDLVLYNLASAQFKIGQNIKANENFIRSLNIRKEKIGQNDIRIGRIYSRLADLAKIEDKHNDAKEYYEYAYKVFLESLGENHKNTLLLKGKLDQLNVL